MNKFSAMFSAHGEKRGHSPCIQGMQLPRGLQFRGISEQGGGQSHHREHSRTVQITVNKNIIKNRNPGRSPRFIAKLLCHSATKTKAEKYLVQSGTLLFSGFRPPTNPRVALPLALFYDIHIKLIDRKIFLKAPLAPIQPNFEGERADGKTQIFRQNFSKKPKNAIIILIRFK